MKTRGFTLIEIMVVLMVVGLLMAMGLRMTGSLVLAQKRYTTRERIATIDAALVSYVSQMRRLPCPADGALPPGHASAGVEQRSGFLGICLNSQARGVVPWRTIGLSTENVTDGFFTMVTYRVATGLTRDDAMKLADCDPAGTASASGSAPYQSCRTSCSAWDMTSCTTPQLVLVNRGIEVRTATSGGVVIADPAATPATGAAYVLISHGENRGGGYDSEGGAQQASTTMGPGETQNAATSALAAFYVDATQDVNAQSAAHFDDFLSRPTILLVASKANLGPRSQH